MKSIVLGTAQFGLPYGITNHEGQLSFEEVCSILEVASKSNMVSALDTSAQYGNSELIIGNATKEINKSFDIITKTKKFSDLSRKEACALLVSDFEASIAKLANNRITTLLFHSEDDLLLDSSSDLYLTALELKKLYKGLKIGVSVYSVEKLEKIISKYSIDAVQFPFNFFDRRFLEVYNELKVKNIDVYIRSVFLQGALLEDSIKSLPITFQAYEDYFSAYQRKVEQSKVTKLQFNVAFAKMYFDKLVLGVTSTEDLLSNLNAFQQEHLNINGNEIHFKKHLPKRLIDPREWKL